MDLSKHDPPPRASNEGTATPVDDKRIVPVFETTSVSIFQASAARQIRVVLLVVLATFLFFASFRAILGQAREAALDLGAVSLILGLYFYLRKRPAQHARVIHALGGLVFVTVNALAIQRGLSRPAIWFLVGIPVVIGMLDSAARLIPWTLLVAADYLLLGLSTSLETPIHQVVLTLSVAGVAYVTKRSSEERLEALERGAEIIELQRQALEWQSKDLRGARDAAIAAARAKSEFLATMSHEIRTPLNGVLGMTSVLLASDLPQEHRSLVESIRQSGDALLALLNDILDFSKVEAGRLSIEDRTFDIREVCEDAAEVFSTRAAEKHLELVTRIDNDVPSLVSGDPNRLRQILVNLLGNAIKFTERGEIVFRAAVEREGLRDPEKIRIHFSIRDSGIGIPAASLEGLFSSFTQVDASTSRRYGGSGLGLAIVRRLTELMGGTSWAESKEGVGSTFHATIVCREQEPGTASHKQFLKSLRVKVFEPHPLAAESICDLVTSLGGVIVPTEAARGNEGGVDSVALRTTGKDAAAEPLLANNDVSVAIVSARARGVKLPLSTRVVLLSPPGELEVAGRLRYAEHGVTVVHKPVRAASLVSALLNEGPKTVVQTTLPVLAERKPLRILLAEDDPVNQRVAILLLSRLGYRADVAADGAEAIAACKTRIYDLVLMDLRMPRVDGFSATRTIRSMLSAREQPWIVAMTADALPEHRKACEEAGMDDFVSKPVVLTEVEAAIVRAMPNTPELRESSKIRVLSVRPPSNSPPKAKGSSVLHGPDITNLRMLAAGSDEGLDALIDSFLTRAEEILLAIGAALEAEKFEELTRHAHTLRGSSAMFGARTVATLAGEVEDRSKRNDLAGTRRFFEGLEAAFAEAKEELLKIRN